MNTEEKIDNLADGSWKIELEALERIDVCKRLRAAEAEVKYQANISAATVSMLGKICALCKSDENTLALHAVEGLIAQRDELLAALKQAESWLEGWASADYELGIIRAAIAKAVQS